MVLWVTPLDFRGIRKLGSEVIFILFYFIFLFSLAAIGCVFFFFSFFFPPSGVILFSFLFFSFLFFFFKFSKNILSFRTWGWFFFSFHVRGDFFPSHVRGDFCFLKLPNLPPPRISNSAPLSIFRFTSIIIGECLTYIYVLISNLCNSCV